MKKPQIILASTSPRRKALMERTGVKFKIINPDYEEDMTLDLPPKKLAAVLSMGKAMSVARHHSNAVIIAADTFIVFGNKVIGKPKNRKDAARILREFSGKKHSILTGLALVWHDKNKKFSAVSETKVTFRKLTDAEIKSYVSMPEPMDKAGAYAIHGLGGMFTAKVEGDYSGAIGLPLSALAKGLKSFGFSIYK